MTVLCLPRVFARVLPLLALLTLVGCGSKGPKTHAVAGQIKLQSGAITQLAGSTLEVALASDPSIRAFGQIQDDGRFELNSLQNGELKTGVLEGRYTARIIPNDEDGESRKRATQAIPPRYLKFETSGLELQVPPDGEIHLQLAAK